jgi:hypothetical protein
VTGAGRGNFPFFLLVTKVRETAPLIVVAEVRTLFLSSISAVAILAATDAIIAMIKGA